MRVLGLDVGSKTIGVAASDELGLAAYPRVVLARRALAADLAAVTRLVAEEAAGRVVVGLPLSLEGELGPMARRVLAFVDALRAALGEAVPVETWDERFSTAAVERVLIQGHVSRSRRKQVIDKQAAAYILQGWLDAQKRDGDEST